MILQENHIFQGMRRGNHQIKQNGSFLWDAHNIRISDKEDNTFFSITNEKGTDLINVSFAGKYVGHCVLNDYLIVFTGDIDKSKNHIYKVDKDYNVTTLFEYGKTRENGWTPEHPIEAFGVYESELVQKVYWVDGINQPRVINIAKENAEYNQYSFDFVQTLQLQEEVEVTKLYGEGMFTPGTIQYAFTYYNKYGQESNIFYTTPLNYISFKERGGNQDETVSNSFQIEVKNIDPNFEYMRIYSIHRSSIDGVPDVRMVTDISLEDKPDSVSYIDAGIQGESVDPMMLLYIGGREIIASAICSKDNTLFLGNFELQEGKDWNSIKKYIQEGLNNKNNHDIEWEDIKFDETVLSDGNGKYYSYESTMSNPGFKSNETYRCGIQFQHKTGTWSEPIFLDDRVLNTVFPRVTDSTMQWNSKGIRISNELSQYLIQNGYQKARTCVVFPSKIDRDIICQGILCPTVYNVGGRMQGAPYAMSSWLLRATPTGRPQLSVPNGPVVTYENIAGSNIYKGTRVQHIHNKPLFWGNKRGAEIQGIQENDTTRNINYINDIQDNAEELSNFFFVDQNIVTMHSPDIDFDESFTNLDLNTEFELKILGQVTLDAIYGDISLQTSSAARSSFASGFVHKLIGYQTGDITIDNLGINSGLVSGLFYNDGLIIGNPNLDDYSQDSTENKGVVGAVNHMVYMWHRSGSVNNDSAQSTYNDKVINSAILEKKKIANLNFFNGYIPAENSVSFDIIQPKLFFNDQLVAEKIWIPYLGKEVVYYGNVDTLAVTDPEKQYPLYSGSSFSGEISEVPSQESGKNVINKTADPVRIKYKSTPHLVFSLSNKENKSIPILPFRVLESYATPNYKLPDWDINNSSKYKYESDNDVLEIATFTSSLSGAVQSWEQGKLRYCAKSGDYYSKGFVFCTRPSASDVHSNISYSAAKALVKEGTVFKVTGGSNDNNANCRVYRDDFNLFKDSEIGDSSVLKVTKYFKAKNVQYKGDVVYAELEETAKPSESTRGDDEESLGENEFKVTKSFLNNSASGSRNSTLVLAELRRKNVSVKFGGNNENDLRNNIWVPSGKPISLESNETADYKYGDTWYSRYDCLKTYPFTQEDENSVIEVGSFMCETRINIDGRYDKNRGLLSNLTTTPQNFNLFNPVYSQRDTFFNYKIYDKDFYELNKFGNQVTWSLEKQNSSEIDNWTKVTLANTLDMDGTKGQITALKSTGDLLLCFQEKAFSQLLFNSRVQIPVSDGVPIEISNSYKMEGYRLISENVGCSNKWSIVSTDDGVYFIDSNTEGIYSYKEKPTNVSRTSGMDWWVKQRYPKLEWNPQINKLSKNGIRAFVDIEQGDIYFTPGPIIETPYIEQPDALCYSQKLGEFISFMSYGGTQAMFNFNNGFYSLRQGMDGLRLYQNNKGNYNQFFGEIHGWDFSFISNQAIEQNGFVPIKVFDNIEMNSDVYQTESPRKLLDKCPINFIEISNEYQKGKVSGNKLNMKKKFRVWRGILPRNEGTRQRIRNPWAMIRLGWEPPEFEEPSKEAIIHEVQVKYTL